MKQIFSSKQTTIDHKRKQRRRSTLCTTDCWLKEGEYWNKKLVKRELKMKVKNKEK